MLTNEATNRAFEGSSTGSGAMSAAASGMLVGLIGVGIQASLSPLMHETESAHHGLRLRYELINVDQDRITAQTLPQLLRNAQDQGFRGLNITSPFKQAVLPLLDKLSDEARAVGAVNTVLFDNGVTTGHNTDTSGWGHAFRAALPKADLRCVGLLGAGGAGAAVAHAVLRLGAQHLVVHDRDHDRATALATALRAGHGEQRISAEADVSAAVTQSTGLIHATPTGMDKLPGMPMSANLLRPDLWVAEVVYFPLDTALLKAARALGCATVDGGGMAVWQAVGAFELFTGIAPDPARMNAHFRACVASR